MSMTLCTMSLTDSTTTSRRQLHHHKIDVNDGDGDGWDSWEQNHEKEARESRHIRTPSNSMFFFPFFVLLYLLSTDRLDPMSNFHPPLTKNSPKRYQEAADTFIKITELNSWSVVYPDYLFCRLLFFDRDFQEYYFIAAGDFYSLFIHIIVQRLKQGVIFLWEIMRRRKLCWRWFLT
jgi:hypothetical protein